MFNPLIYLWNTINKRALVFIKRNGGEGIQISGQTRNLIGIGFTNRKNYQLCVDLDNLSKLEEHKHPSPQRCHGINPWLLAQGNLQPCYLLDVFLPNKFL